MRPQRGQHVSALRLEHYIAAPMHLVRSMASGPGPAPVWLSGGRHGGEVETCQSEPVALTLTVATALRVRFELRRGPVRCGAHTLDLCERSGGTMVVFTRELVTFRALGAAMMPAMRFLTGLVMPSRIQNLSLSCADALEQERA